MGHHRRSLLRERNHHVARGSDVLVGHDDLEMYERAQDGLNSRARDWVNVGRLYTPDEAGQKNVTTNGTNEWQMRNQYRAWGRYMTGSESV